MAQVTYAMRVDLWPRNFSDKWGGGRAEMAWEDFTYMRWKIAEISLGRGYWITEIPHIKWWSIGRCQRSGPLPISWWWDNEQRGTIKWMSLQIFLYLELSICTDTNQEGFFFFKGIATGLNQNQKSIRKSWQNSNQHFQESKDTWQNMSQRFLE